MLRLTYCALVLAALALAGSGFPRTAYCAAAPGSGSAAAPSMDMPQVQPLIVTPCAMCAQLGHMCPNCTKSALALMSSVASQACGNCTADDLCETCVVFVDAALAKVLGLKADTVDNPGIPAAYIAGKMSDDREQLIMKAVEAAQQQGLLSGHSGVGSIYPDIMSAGMHPDSTVYAIVIYDSGQPAQAPLTPYEIPAGRYVRFTHMGNYEQLGVTWVAALAFAKLHGLGLGTGPCGEEYFSDPATTPESELVTYIYIPLADTGIATALHSQTNPST